MLLKLGGMTELVKWEVDVGRNDARRIARMAERGGDGENSGHLILGVRDGSLAGCVVKEEVGEVLRSAHDAQGHFLHEVTARRLYGRHYWPTCNAHIAHWIATYYSCQRDSPIRKDARYDRLYS